MQHSEDVKSNSVNGEHWIYDNGSETADIENHDNAINQTPGTRPLPPSLAERTVNTATETSGNRDLRHLNDFQIPFIETADHDRECMSYAAYKVLDIVPKLVLTHFQPMLHFCRTLVENGLKKGKKEAFKSLR